MHELGSVFHIIDSLQEVARDNGLEQINSVTVEVEEVSTVIPHYLTDCWQWAIKKHDLLKACDMVVETIPAVTHCDGCGKDYPTVAHGKTCPHCGSGETWLLRGNEINIKDISVYEKEE